MSKSKGNDYEEDKEYMDNYFPLFAAITKEYGLITSAVFGNIWRKAQGSGYSFASHQTIAKDLKIDVKTVQRKINKLIELNLITEVPSSTIRRPDYIDKRTISYTWNEDSYKEMFFTGYKNKDNKEFTKLSKEERQALFPQKNVDIQSVDSGQIINEDGLKVQEGGLNVHNQGGNREVEDGQVLGAESPTNIDSNIESNIEVKEEHKTEIKTDSNTRSKIGSASDFVSYTPTEVSSLSGEPVIDFNEDWGIPESIKSNTISDELPESLRLTNELMKKYADSVNQHYDY
ncbi:MAG: helix-turn-helix domain-containing protein [Chloroflexi bacterium]|nr:helix-turn-helix domain-containing protein [Chloroflexota bacterium]